MDNRPTDRIYEDIWQKAGHFGKREAQGKGTRAADRNTRLLKRM